MSNTIDKQAILEQLKEQIAALDDDRKHARKEGFTAWKNELVEKIKLLNGIKDEIQSGRFDSPSDEVQRLRAALVAIEAEMADDTSSRAQRINRLISEAISDTQEPTKKQNPPCPKCKQELSTSREDTYHCRDCRSEWGMWGDGELIQNDWEPIGTDRVKELEDALDKAILEIRIWGECYGDKASKDAAQTVVNELRKVRDNARSENTENLVSPLYSLVQPRSYLQSCSIGGDGYMTDQAKIAEQLQEIKTRWYKDPTLLASSDDVARQAFTDVNTLFSIINELKGEVERLSKDKIKAFIGEF